MSRISARERILDAAEECLRRDGIRRTTVAGVAEEAGVSRAYLYRFFADKPTLLSAALIRRDEEFWSAARFRVAAATGLADMIAQAVLMSRDSPLGPLALALADAEPEAFAEVVGTFVHEIVPGLGGFWADQLNLARSRGWLREDVDIALAVEWVIRVVVSLVEVPGVGLDADDPPSLRSFIETFVVPGLAP